MFMKSIQALISELELHALFNEPECNIPVKGARVSCLERKLVIHQRSRQVLGHHQVIANCIANSHTDSSNICLVTKKQSKAS